LDPLSIKPGPFFLGVSFIIVGHLMYLAHIMLKTHQCQDGKNQSILCKGGPKSIGKLCLKFSQNKMLCPILSEK
jgi:hypothetical protein